MINKNLTRYLAKAMASSALIVGSCAVAFQVPASYEDENIDIGTCTGYATNYEYAAGTGIGNASAILATPVWFGNGVQPYYDGITPGIPYTSPSLIDITSFSAADFLTLCGVADAVLTITGVATGPYADEDLIGYRLEGKDPNNGNVPTVWEVAVSGVTATQVIARKRSLAIPSTTPTPVPVNSPWAILLAGVAIAGAFMRLRVKS